MSGLANSQKLSDSLQQVLQKRGRQVLNDTLFQDAYIQVISKYQNNNPDSALKLCNWLEPFCRKNKSGAQLAELLRQKSIALCSRGRYAEGLSSLEEAKSIALDNRFQKILSKILNNEAIQYKNMGNYKKALELYEESLLLKKQLNDKKGMAATYGNIANVYKNLYDYKKALETIEHAQQLFSEVNDSLGYANCCYTKANLYHLTQELQQSKSNFWQGISISERLGDQVNLAHLYGEMAQLYFDMNQKDSALLLANRGMAISQKLDDQYLIARSYFHCGNLRELEGNFDEALPYYLNGYQISKNTGRLDLLSTFSECLYKTYKGLGKPEIAIGYLEDFKIWEDSLLNEANRKKMLEFQARLEFEEKEKTLMATQASLKQESYIQRWVIGLVLVLLSLSVIQSWRLFRNRQKLKKSYAQLELANKEIQELNANLQLRVEERTENLEKANEILREFSFTNSHKVRKPVANILGLIEAFNLAELNSEEQKNILNHIHESVKELDKIIHDINERTNPNNLK